ncbi:MAG: hypothetical protein HY537_03585 [Deltaproteobacteria bacterium]|nr:hypothetical protein [Deltaproteobacteria bacterium]
MKINCEIVVIMSPVGQQTCGIVFVDSEEEQKEFKRLLDTVWNTLREKSLAQAEEIEVKAFGLSQYKEKVIQTLKHWTQDQSTRITAQDLGRGVSRTLTISCKSGKVGVHYADDNQQRRSLFIARGTFRNRGFTPPAFYKILVLTKNRVTRQLCMQAVEELPGHKAICPLNPAHFLERTFGLFPYSAVCLFEDVGKSKNVEPWIKRFLKKFPHSPILWIGRNAPQGIDAIGSIDSESIVKFKEEIARILLPQTSLILPFARGNR